MCRLDYQAVRENDPTLILRRGGTKTGLKRAAEIEPKLCEHFVDLFFGSEYALTRIIIFDE